MRGRDALGDDPGPGCEDQLAHLGDVERVHARDDPVKPQVRVRRHLEHVRAGRDHGGTLLLGKAEPHGPLVAREGDIDDGPDPELDAVPHQDLIGPRQPLDHCANVVHRDHARSLPRWADIDDGGGVTRHGGGARTVGGRRPARTPRPHGRVPRQRPRPSDARSAARLRGPADIARGRAARSTGRAAAVGGSAFLRGGRARAFGGLGEARPRSSRRGRTPCMPQCSDSCGSRCPWWWRCTGPSREPASPLR